MTNNRQPVNLHQKSFNPNEQKSEIEKCCSHSDVGSAI